MNKILIPTDLSDLGDFAYAVASKIAGKTGAEIHLLSIIPGPQGAVYNKEGNLQESDGNDYSEFYNHKEDLELTLIEYRKDKPDVTHVKVNIGRIDQDVLYYAESNGIDLIIMGTEGAYGMKEWVRGSHAEYITNHSMIPVLSLKCDRSNLLLDEIVFASDFMEKKKLNLRVLKELQKSFQSTILLLRIKTPKETRDDATIIKMMKEFVAVNNLEDVEYNIYPYNSVEHGINVFCAERNIDLIVMGTHQRHGISKLFRQNIADDVVNHLFHPILTFPL